MPNNNELYEAAKNGQLDLVKNLVESGAQLDAANTVDLDYPGATAIWIAAKNQKWDVVEYLLDKYLLDKIVSINNMPTWLEYKGETLLHLAAGFGNLDLVEKLNNLGVDLDAVATGNSQLPGATPIWIAAFRSQWHVVKYLITNGATLSKTPTAGEFKNKTLLYLAAEQGELDIVDMLVTKGVKLDTADTEDLQFPGATPIWIAAFKSHWYVVLYLLEKGAKLTETPIGGLYKDVTLFYFSLRTVNLDLDPLEELIVRGADVSDFIDDIPPYNLSSLITSLEEKYLYNTKDNPLAATVLATIILLRKKFYSLIKPEGLLTLKAPETNDHNTTFAKESLNSQHEQIKQSAFNVINKHMLDMLGRFKSKKISNLFSEIEKREITTLSESGDEIKQINNCINDLRFACDCMAAITPENIATLLKDGNIKGEASEMNFKVGHIALRLARLQKKYPTYDSFETAVLANMKIPPGQKIDLSKRDKAYLQLQYVAISDAEIRPNLNKTLEAELLKISNTVAKYNAPAKILDAVNKYKGSLSNDDKIKLENVLSQSLILLVAEVDLDAIYRVVHNIIGTLNNYRNNLSILDAKQLLNKLKAEYDIELNRPAPARHNNKLYEAAKNGQLDLVESLVEGGAQLDTANTEDPDYPGATAIWIAAKNQKWDVVEYLLNKYLFEKSADLNKAPTGGEYKGATLLHLFAGFGKLDLVENLYNRGVDLDTAGTGNPHTPGATAIWIAALGLQWHVVKYLIENGASLSKAPTGGGYKDVTLLYLAAQHGQVDIVKELINKHVNLDIATVGNLSYPGAPGATAAWVAAFNSHWDIVIALLESGGVTLAKSPTEGDFNDITLHDLAVQQRKLGFVGHLLKSALPGATPIWIAALDLRWDLVRYMLKGGADFTKVPTWGRYKDITLLYLASQAGQLDLVKDLVEKNAALDTAATAHNITEGLGFPGATAIWIAAFNSHWEVVTYLLEKGADFTKIPTGGEYKGITLLSLLSQKGQLRRLDLLEKLIVRGADVSSIISRIDSDYLLPLVTSLEDKYLHKTQDKEINPTVFAAIIFLRKELYNRAKDKGDILRAPETSDTDMTFAIKSLSKVKTYFEKNNQGNIPEFSKAVLSIREMLIERIQKSNPEPTVRDSLTPFNKDEFFFAHDKNDISHLALLWIASFENDIMFSAGSATTDSLIKEMLCYIVACRDNLQVNGGASREATEIEYALVLQLSNLMQARGDGTISCASGTPRGLRVVLDVYLRLKQPQHLQHEQVKQSAFNIINNVMLNTFKVLKAIQINGKGDADPEQINKLTNNFKFICDYMADIGSHNIDTLLKDGVIDGAASGKSLLIFNFIQGLANVQKSYPKYDRFEDAVLTDMQILYGKKIVLSAQDKAYLRLQYVSISNEEIRPKFYETLETELSKYDSKAKRLRPC